LDARQRRFRRPVRGFLAAATLLAGMGVLPALQPLASPVRAHAATVRAPGASACVLSPTNSAIKHVVFLEFDNTHFERDVARTSSGVLKNVPSDLEQIPSLYNFMTGNGTLLTNHHTPLISHTSDDIITSETGVYPARHGVATAANSYQYYKSDGTTAFQSGFTYWTDKIGNGSASNPGDGQYNLTSAPNTNAPAPWVPFTRAGCNFAGVGMADMELENTGADLAAAFGSPLPPAVANDPNKFADFEGVAIHCANGDALCSSNNGGYPDVLPSEPSGYTGFNALYGHKFITQAFSNTGALAPNTNLKDINNNDIVNDFPAGTLTPGFPGFSLQPEYALGYTADMLEAGVPVVWTYIITPHNPLGVNPYNYGHPNDRNSYGPGEANYVDQLKKDYDASFTKFFARLAADGIDKGNTLFVISSDEQDHNINGAPSPLNCDGVTTPCSYTQNGELAVNYNGLIQAEQGGLVTTPSSATVTNDDAPDIYLKGNPAPADPGARAFEQATGAVTITNPISANLGLPANEKVTQFLANPAEFQALHMVTADPLRTPSFTAFAQPDYYVQSGNCPAGTTAANASTACVTQNPAFNWNHGDVQQEISTSWLGLVGPGVNNNRYDGPSSTTGVPQNALPGAGTFSDHTDIRPTMLALLGLKDDYTQDGRALVEDLTNSALPASIGPAGSDSNNNFRAVAAEYKQCNAPVGDFGLTTLQKSTVALESATAGDSAFNTIESRLTTLTAQRDGDATRMRDALYNATFNGTPITNAQANSLVAACQADRAQAQTLDAGLTGGGGGTNTPELGSGELLVAGLGPIVVALLYRRRRQRRAARKTA